MFLGTFYSNIDQKGRIILPAKLRAVLEEKYSSDLVLTNLDSCIVSYPLKEWLALEEKARLLPTMKQDVRSFMRLFYAGASSCSLDKQGRILISPYLREFAGLNKEVVLLGISNKIEIWSKDRWSEFLSGAKGKIGEFAERLADIGF